MVAKKRYTFSPSAMDARERSSLWAGESLGVQELFEDDRCRTFFLRIEFRPSDPWPASLPKATKNFCTYVLVA
jgi:hypothetical protein